MNAIERIISAIPAEAGFSDKDRSEARTLLMACVLWALPSNAPGRDGIKQLRSLTNGSGRWLYWVRKGIDAAALTANERGFFFGGFGMATALMLSFSLPAQESAALPAPPRSSKKQPKPSPSRAPRSTQRVAEVVLPPEWQS